MRFINWIDSEFMTLQGIKFDQMHENQIHQFDENKIHHSDKSKIINQKKITINKMKKFINSLELNLSIE